MLFNKYIVRILLIVLGLIFSIIPHLEAGTIKGKITAKKNFPRRVAVRYPGKHGQQPRQLDPIPAVALVLGEVKGYPPPAAGAGAPPEIKQKDFKFQPSLLIIPVGTTVSFPNQDLEFHNVFSYSKTKRFDLGRYHKGESKSVYFDNPGIGQIYCEIHEWMRAVIVVVENPFFSIADDDGNYQINDIPQGSYRLLVWKIDHKKTVHQIDVPAEGILELNFTLPEEKSDERE